MNKQIRLKYNKCVNCLYVIAEGNVIPLALINLDDPGLLEFASSVVGNREEQQLVTIGDKDAR